MITIYITMFTFLKIQHLLHMHAIAQEADFGQFEIACFEKKGIVATVMNWFTLHFRFKIS